MESSEETKKSLSFGFSRRKETVQLNKSVVNDQDDGEDNTRDFVLSLEGKEVKSRKPARENKKKEFIIPLIQQNRWRMNENRSNAEDCQISNGNESNNLELLAAEEIIRDAAKLNDNWEQNHIAEDSVRSIPLLMQNKIPEGYETDDKLDVNLRPEEPTDTHYDEIPIEHFGLAMLRGMGWNENRGVGKNGKVIAPVEAQARPKGLGLGADRSNEKQSKSKGKPDEKDSSEPIELKKGAYCIVTSGSNKDLYAAIEGVDEDNSRVMVKLALNGKTCNLMQCNTSLVSKTEYDKYSKYLNKQKADKYKKDEEERLAQSETSNGYPNKHKSHKSKRQISEDYENNDDHRKEHKRHKIDDKESDTSSHKRSSTKHKKKHKSHNDEHYSRGNDRRNQSPSSSENEDDTLVQSIDQRLWVQPDIRVRVVDESYKRFYKDKVVIVDVPSPGMCVCKSSDGKVIDGISQSSLETVIPRDDDSFVLIVSGSHRGNVGQIMKRDKSKCLCIVQLLSDRDIVLKLGYDEVCEYVGNVHAREDY